MSTANSSPSERRTTVPGNWLGCNGITRYASDTSLTAPWLPGGRVHSRRHVFANVPHKQGYKVESIVELIDVMVLLTAKVGCMIGVRGCEKFCTRRNFPGELDFGTIEIGDVWKRAEDPLDDFSREGA